MTRNIRTGFVALVAAAAVAFSGCAAMEDMATNPEKENTRKGAGYGAAAGAVIGLLTGGNNKFKSAMIGAAAGALVGGAVGYYMDKQEAKLRQQMAGTGVDVVRKGDNITLDMPGGVTFAFDSADLNSQFYPGARQGGSARSPSTTRRSSKWPGTPTAWAATPTTSSSPRTPRQQRGDLPRRATASTGPAW